MLIKEEKPDGFLAGMAILALGIALGAATQCVRRSRAADGEERAPVPAARAADAPPDNGLETLRITREGAGAPDAASVELEDDRSAVRIEIGGARDGSGDRTLHVQAERALAGLRRFAVEPADPRSALLEWALLEAVRREDLVAPRATFVNLVEDGRFSGVAFLVEELPGDADDGRFVRWEQDARWTALFQQGLSCLGTSGEPTAALAPLTSLEPVSQALERASADAAELRKRAQDSPLSSFQALEELRGQTLERIFDVERLAELHALLTLFQADDSAARTCYLHDRRDSRLQPVCLLPATPAASSREPVPYRTIGPCALTSSPAYGAALFRSLGQRIHSAWLDELFADLEPELSRFERALSATGSSNVLTADALRQRLRAQTLFLRQTLLPADPINFAATYAVDDSLAQYVTGEIEVRAWATTQVPVLLEGFRFSNDIFASAASALTDSSAARVTNEGVVLPSDGRSVTFRFPLNERLASLESANVLVKSARARTAGKQALTLDVRAVFRTLAAADSSEELLDFVKREPEGAPDAPGSQAGPQ